MTKKIPSVCVSLPAYDQMHVGTCLSLVKLFDKFTAAKIKTTINTFKCPYIGYSRNILAALFLQSGFDYQLFVDADVEFEPDVVGRMIIAEKDFIWVENAVLSNDKTFVAPEISAREALRRLDCLGTAFQ